MPVGFEYLIALLAPQCLQIPLTPITFHVWDFVVGIFAQKALLDIDLYIQKECLFVCVSIRLRFMDIVKFLNIFLDQPLGSVVVKTEFKYLKIKIIYIINFSN